MNVGTEPMELRPLSLGEIIDRTAQLYRSNFLLFVGITVFPTAILLVLGLVQVALMRTRTIGAGIDQITAGSFLFVGGMFLGFTIYAVLTGVSLAATNRAVSDIYLGEPATIGRAYLQVKPHWFRYIWLMFVAAIYAWAPVFLLFFVAAGAVGVIAALHIGPQAIWLLPLVVFGGMLLIFPFGVWMTLRYAVSVPASIFEDLRIHASLKRSVTLTKGSRGRIFVLFLLVVAIAVVLSVAVQMPLIVLTAIKTREHAVVPLIAQVLGQVGSFLVNALLGPVYGIAITLFYYDLRIRKEGFDIQWMMDRARLGIDPSVAIESPAISAHPEVGPQ